MIDKNSSMARLAPTRVTAINHVVFIFVAITGIYSIGIDGCSPEAG